MTESAVRLGLAARIKRQASDGGVTAVAIGLMNVSTYVYTMLAANILGPRSYGAFLALSNLVLIVWVASLSLQTTAARRISADPEHVGQIEREIMRVASRGALALGGLLLLLTPVINALLGLDSLATAALIGISVVPLTILGGQQGILQGERRWRPLGLLYLLSGVPRLIIGSVLILVEPSTFMAMLGVAVACFIPTIAGWAALRSDRTGVTRQSTHHDSASILKEIRRSSQGLLAFFALVNVDIIVARNVLDAHDAGLYAAGLIVTKAVMFLPQFVVVVAFPAMSTTSERRRALVRSLSLVAALGICCVVGSWLLSGVAMRLAGGAEYAEVQSQLWIFAVVGTAMSMIQLLVYSVVARQSRANLLVWGGVIALVCAGLTASSVSGLLIRVLLVDSLVLAAMLAASVHALRLPAEAADNRPGRPVTSPA